MSRSEKNAAGKDVRVDTPDYGCKTVEHAPKTPAKTAEKATDKGEN